MSYLIIIITDYNNIFR